MKTATTILLIFSAVLLQTVAAEPQLDLQELGLDTDAAVKDFLEAIKNSASSRLSFGESVLALSEFLINGTRELGDLFGQHIRSVLEEKIHSFATLVSALRYAVEAQLAAIQANRDRTSLINIINVLKAIESSAADLENKIKDMRAVLTEELKNAESMAEQWAANWAAVLMEIVATQSNNNSEAMEQAKLLIDAFVDYFRTKAHACAAEVLNEVNDLENLVNITITRYESALRALVQQISICLQQSNYRQCIRLAERGLRPIRNAARDVRILSAKVEKLKTEDMTTRKCFRRVSLEFHWEYYQLEKKIKELIAAANGVDPSTVELGDAEHYELVTDDTEIGTTTVA